MLKFSKLVTLTTGVCLGLGCLWDQEASAAILGPDFSGETIQKISLIVDEVSITPQSSSTDYRLGLQLKVSFLDEEEQPAERIWFINRDSSFNNVGSFLGLIVYFCESSDTLTSDCFSLFEDRFIIINNETESGREFSRTNDGSGVQIDSNIIDLLSNGEDNNVRLQTYLNGNIFGSSFQQSSTEESAFFLSTPAPEPAVVPEPLTILGSGTAMGFGTFFKCKLGQRKSASKKA
ncbi:MAG: PEP-CTERM sorting domain-containing protein [Crocosphaera sp.]|nr:PEP-CTERM sorting domain-containing protein [Crocosphaera sp.]